MRIWPSLFALSLVAANQSPLSSTPSTTSTTLIDALNDDPDYTSLLDLLQHARLIPTLNKLNGSTFFAPTNDAIKRHQDAGLWLHDNIHEKLRQELFYHLLNYTLPDLSTAEPSVEIHKTLHFPHSINEFPSPDPAPAPPWIPLPGSGTLGGEPQRLRVSAREGGAWVGVDAFGKGGVQIVKGRVDVRNGVLLGIDNVLPVPGDLATVTRRPEISYFNSILTPALTSLLNSTSALTIFLPVDDAWAALDKLERLYLESEYATDDLLRILDMHAVQGKHGVSWSDAFDPGVNLTTLDGRTLEVITTPSKTMISSSTLLHPDIYASNGVLHLVSSLLIPPGALHLTPEKYLLALNCSAFVSLLHSVNLTALINSTQPDARYTILAPRDDILSVFGDGEVPDRGTDELKRMLQYHFIPGRWTPKKLRDGMLMETELIDGGLGKERQVLSVEVDTDDKLAGPQNVRFGGAGIIGDPIEINNTIVYFISRPLTPPSDVLQTVLPKLDLSSFLAAIFSTTLADKLRVAPRTTLLIPHNAAFKRLGLLVSAHLLSASSKSDLENVILHHAINGVEYAQSLQNGSQRTFPTLEGSDIKLERPEKVNSSVLVTASGGWAGMKSLLHPQNTLTRTGVVHELSDLMIPRSVDLTVGKLVKAAKGSTMASMVVKVGMDWVLNGTSPPEGSPWAEKGLNGAGWTLLCPTDDAFKKFNLTKLFEDLDSLTAIVSQHLIPTPTPISKDGLEVLDVLNNNRPLQLDNSATYSTLLSPSSAYGDIIFRPADDPKSGGYVVGINGARGTDGSADSARVLAWGRSTTGGGTGGVIQIDQLLAPYHPPWWIAWGGPAVVGVVGLIAICAFFYGVRLVWRRDTTEATYEPVGGFGQDDEA